MTLHRGPVPQPPRSSSPGGFASGSHAPAGPGGPSGQRRDLRWDAPAVPASSEPLAPVGLPAGVRRPGRPGVGTALALVVLSVLLVMAVAAVGMSVGVQALPVAGLLAAVPLAVVLVAIAWVDRWEREPWPALAVAFGWGASVSVLVALVLNTGAMTVMVALGSPPGSAEVVGAVFVAPVVEEGIKGLGVLLLFFGWRRSFDGPVDGLVYAATLAAGFAFVENILYFGRMIAEASDYAGGSQAVATIFLLRGVMSPFAHLLFTACTGLALGLAARSRSRATWLLAFPIGLGLAVVLHGIWNASASAAGQGGFLTTYITFQVPLFLGVVALAVYLRRREARVVRTRLSEYAAAGWLAPGEVEMLSSLRSRRQAQTWARARSGERARRAMRLFQAAATRLAYQRHRVCIQRDDARAAIDEQVLLAELSVARAALVRALAA